MPIGRPRAILFDLFHTLVSVPPVRDGERLISDILGVPSSEWQRHFYEEDTFGRALGRVTDPVDAMRLVAHAIDPSVADDRILEAVAIRRKRFESALLEVDPRILDGIVRARAAGIRTALVSDAGADDVEAWTLSPLRALIDVPVFSFEVGVRKPAAEIYRHALDALDVGPEEAIFVGDGGSNEHWGARQIGLRTVLVTRLLSEWWPALVEPRRVHADWVFDDVGAFVDALALDGGPLVASA